MYSRRDRLLCRRAREWTIAAWWLLAAGAAHAQVARPPGDGRGSRVSGIVYDSIARMPLAGATVQIAAVGDAVRMSRSTVSDSAGRYTLDSIPSGEYLIGFFHVMLDSLGIEPPVRRLSVAGPATMRYDIGIPGPEAVHTAVCGPRAPNDSTGIMVGIVRDAQSLAPVARASVTTQWQELSFTTQGFSRRVPRFSATTNENGWFAFCGLPPLASVEIIAVHDRDSTAMIELELPISRFARRDLYLGPSVTTIVADTESRADSVALPPHLFRTGTIRLSGTVAATADGRPLPGAHVVIDNGPQATTNERGEWSIGNAPPGTNMLSVRAVGFYPERRVVDIIERAPPVRVSLSTLKAVLDTVKVNATHLYNRDRNGFQRRRQSGIGRYLGPQEIERMHPIATSDLFRMMPSVRVTQRGFDKSILMRGGMSGYCAPAIFLDGMRIEGLSGGDIDGWVQPNEIVGVEVYTLAGAPPQFQTLNGCGTILIWTR